MSADPTSTNAPEPFRQGNLLAIPPDAVFPKRCVFCNMEATDPPVTLTIGNPVNDSKLFRTLTVISAGGVAGAIGAGVAGAANGAAGQASSLDVKAYLCEAHRRERKKFFRTLTILILVLLCVIVLATAIALLVTRGQGPAKQLVPLLTMIAGGLALIIYTKIAQRGKRLVLKRIDAAGVFYASGVGPAFLGQLPSH